MKHISLLALVIALALPCYADEIVFGSFTSSAWGGMSGGYIGTTLPLLSTCGPAHTVDAGYFLNSNDTYSANVELMLTCGQPQPGSVGVSLIDAISGAHGQLSRPYRYWVPWTQEGVVSVFYRYYDGTSYSDHFLSFPATYELVLQRTEWGDAAPRLAFRMSFNTNGTYLIPEPCSMILVGSGLAGLYWKKKSEGY